jgi:RNA polymerase sigma-70 factor, ECF subfamily
MVVSPSAPDLEPSDVTLAAGAAAGDARAFEALVERYQSRVYRLACRLANETEAPDLLQETFLQVYKHLKSFRGDSRFGTWLYRIATNVCLMHLRARDRRPVEPLDRYMPSFDDDGGHAGTPADLQAASSTDEVLDRQVLAASARDGIARLPDLYREAFVLRDLEDLPTSEVARILEIEPAAVRQRVHRARLMLRGYLQHLVVSQRGGGRS